MAHPTNEHAARPDQAPAQSPTNLLQMAWQYKWLVLLGLTVGLAGSVLVYARSQPIYRSSAQLLVIKKRSDVVPISGGDVTQSYLEDYVSTHIVLLKSPVILGKAVQDGALNGLRTFEGNGNVPASLAASLGASRDATGATRTIIHLTFEGPYPAETAKVLDAVIGSYTEFLEGAYRNVSREAELTFVSVSQKLKKNLADEAAAYRQFRETSPVLLRRTKEGGNVHQVRMDEIETKKSAGTIRKAELEGRIRSITAAKKAGKLDLEFLLEREAKPEAPGKIGASIEEQLLTLRLEEQELLEDFGEGHPRVRSVRAKIARLRAALEQGGRDEPRPESKGPDRDAAIDRLLRSLRHEVEQIEESLKTYDALLNKEHDQAKFLSGYEIRDEELRSRLSRTQQLYDLAIQKIKEIDLVRDFGGYDAKVIAPAGLGVQIAPNLSRNLMMGAVIGLLLGFGLAYLAEVTDKSFRSPEEIRRRLGLPILGHIPLVRKHPGGTNGQPKEGTPGEPDAAVCVQHRPSSAEAEAYRSLRTAVFFATKGTDSKVIQITSPSMGDGKTTLAVNLAVAISQSGKRVILVDADLRRPKVCRHFGLTQGASITEVLSGESFLAEAIQPTAVPGLSVLPCTNRPTNPAELLTLPAFERILNDLRGQFDYVIVDTPPLLAVTDPCIVAGRVDGVMMAVRVAKNGRPAAERAKEMLTSLGVRVFGVIVNGTGKEASYGYGSYGYRDYAYDEYSYQYRSEPEPSHASSNGKTSAG